MANEVRFGVVKEWRTLLGSMHAEKEWVMLHEAVEFEVKSKAVLWERTAILRCARILCHRDDLGKWETILYN
jgi:hypothetical protein